MVINSLKRQITLITSSLMLVTTLIVASFAWYKMSNGGNLKVVVPTTEASAIAFSFSSYKDVDGTLVPAKMKQGVINNTFNKEEYLNGKYEQSMFHIPVDKNTLAKTTEVLNPSNNEPLFESYVLNNDENLGIKKLVPKSEYLEEPGSVIYRQFSLRLGSTSNDAEKNALFKIDVDYYDILHHDKSDAGLHSLKQKDALAFSFYVFDSKINDGTLSEISTVINKDASSKKTISEMFYDPLEKGRYVKSEDKVVNANKEYYVASKIQTPSSISIINPSYFFYNKDADQYELCTTQDTTGKDFYTLIKVDNPINADMDTYYEHVTNRLYRFKENKGSSSYRLVPDSQSETWINTNANYYNIVPFDTSTEDKFSMQVSLEGLEFNKTYYVLTAVYYKVPDELLDGDLWLANRLDINIAYEIEVKEVETPQE